MEKVIKTTLANCQFAQFDAWIKSNMQLEAWFDQTFEELFNANIGGVKFVNLPTVIKEETIDSNEDYYEFNDDANIDYQDPYRSSFNNYDGIDVTDRNEKLSFVFGFVATTPVKIIKIIKKGYVPPDRVSIKNILLMKNDYLIKLLFDKLYEEDYISRLKLSDEILVPYVKSKDADIRFYITQMISTEGLNQFVGETNKRVINGILKRFDRLASADKEKMKDIMSYIAKNEIIRDNKNLRSYWMTSDESQKDLKNSYNKLQVNKKDEKDQVIPGADGLYSLKDKKVYDQIISIGESGDQDGLFSLFNSIADYYRDPACLAILFLMRKLKISISTLYKIVLSRKMSTKFMAEFYNLLPYQIIKLIYANYSESKNRQIIGYDDLFLKSAFLSDKISFNEKVDFLFIAFKIGGGDNLSYIANFLAGCNSDNIDYFIKKFNNNPKFFKFFIVGMNEYIFSPALTLLRDKLLTNLSEENIKILFEKFAGAKSTFDSLSRRELYNKFDADIATNLDYNLSKIIRPNIYAGRMEVNDQISVVIIRMILSIYNDNYSDLITLFKENKDLVKEVNKEYGRFSSAISRLKENIKSGKLDSIKDYKSSSYFEKIQMIAQTKSKDFLKEIYEEEQKVYCPPNILKFIKQRYLDNNNIITDLPKQMMDLIETIFAMI